MPATREELVRIVRDSIGTSECDNPITFDPPEWALRAVASAYERGAKVARVLCPECEGPADHCSDCGTTKVNAEPSAAEASAAGELAELRDALTCMLDSFEPQMDKDTRREYRALAAGSP